MDEKVFLSFIGVFRLLNNEKFFLLPRIYGISDLFLSQLRDLHFCKVTT